MIFVTRIIGESYDFSSGSQLPKSMVVSNGVREINIAVSDEVAIEVLALMAELRAQVKKAMPPAPVVPVVHSPAKLPESDYEEPVTEVRTNLFRGQGPAKAPTASPYRASFTEEAQALLAPVGVEPGSEYDDEGTGVESL
jgi:hypothetical protein